MLDKIAQPPLSMDRLAVKKLKKNFQFISPMTSAVTDSLSGGGRFSDIKELLRISSGRGKWKQEGRGDKQGLVRKNYPFVS